MRPEIFVLYGCKELDKVIRRVEEWLNIHSKSIMGYHKKAIVKRLTQRVVSLITVPFLKERTNRYLNNGQILFDDVLRFGGLVTNSQNGKVTPSVGLFLSCSAKFIILWLCVLAAWLLTFIRWRSGKKAAALLYGIPFEALKYNDNDARFVNFCLNGPIAELKKSDTIIVESSHQINATMPHYIRYPRFPLLSHLSSSEFGCRENIFFIRQHLSAFVLYFYCVTLMPINCLLWRDFSEHSAVAVLNDSKLINGVIITNSNWGSQYLWMFALQDRQFKTCMALYSLNSQALTYKDDPIYAPYPVMRYLSVDKIWIWNESYKELLARDGIEAETEVLPPILWFLPTKNKTGESGSIRICVFDVTPKSKEWILYNLGIPESYYSTENIKRFLTDIIYAIGKVQTVIDSDVKIILKGKRETHKSDDEEYHRYIRTLLSDNDNIVNTDSDANLFSLIESCDLSVVVPFSSAAYISSYLKKPAIFYDPTGSIVDNDAKEPLIEFINGRDCLADAMLSIIKQNILTH